MVDRLRGAVSWAARVLSRVLQAGRRSLGSWWRARGRRIAVRIAKAIALAVPILLVLSYFALEYTTRPQFCDTCHYMTPYYEAWESSTHNHVPCLDCHFPPGLAGTVKGKIAAVNQLVRYVTGSYGRTRPWVEISDASCTQSGCHDRRLLSGTVEFSGVRFDHAPHLTEQRRGKRLRCTSCHAQIVQREHMTVVTNTCFLCHFKDRPVDEPLAGCEGCHGVPEGVFDVDGRQFSHEGVARRGIKCSRCHIDVVSGEGKVVPERCTFCHADPRQLGRVDDVTLLHDRHVAKHKVDCLRCHDEIRHRINRPAAAMSVDCGDCHPDHHREERELYVGVGGMGVSDHPSAMIEAQVRCTGCHAESIELEEGPVMEAGEATCLACHGTGFVGMLGDWRTHVSSMLTKVDQSIDVVARFVRSSNAHPAFIEQADSLLAAARHNLLLVSRGGGHHNIRYADAVLRAASKQLAEAAEAVGVPYRPPSFPGLYVTANECAGCHISADRDVAATDWGARFPHEPHVVEATIECTRCHSDEPAHGTTIIARADCEACHHGEATFENCVDCHGPGPASPIRVDGASFEHRAHTVIEKMACAKCHDVEQARIATKRDLDCVACHHDGKLERSCGSCHPVQEAVAVRGDGGGVDGVAGAMTGVVECDGCHTSVSRGTTAGTVAEACASCHDGSYVEVLSMWQENVRSGVARTRDRLREVMSKRASAALTDAEQEQVVAAIRDVRNAIDAITADGSLGGHNEAWADAVLARATDALAVAERTVGKTTP